MDNAGPDGAIFFNPLHPIAAKCAREISITGWGNFTEAKTCELYTVVLEVVSVAREAINQTARNDRYAQHPLQFACAHLALKYRHRKLISLNSLVDTLDA